MQNEPLRSFATAVSIDHLRLFNSIARDSISDLQQILIYQEQWHRALRFADLRRELFLDPDHLARMPMRKLERLHEIRFGEFLGRAFDHEDVVFRADVD